MASEPIVIPVRKRWPVALQVVLIYLGARVVTLAFLFTASDLSRPSSRFGSNPGLLKFALGWDAEWYWLIAVQGYPADLPVHVTGEIAQNAWAFMPLYPFFAKLVGAPFGSWAIGAMIISLVGGYLACLALFKLLRRRIEHNTALWAIAFFACAPTAALFHFGYAETLFLLLLFLALDAVAARSYGRLYMLMPLMAFTRPGILAFALFLGLHLLVRWYTRHKEVLDRRQFVHIVSLGFIGSSLGFAWQYIAAGVTGNPDAYLETELAWRRGWGVGESGFLPFDGTLAASTIWFRLWGMPGWVGLIALALIVTCIVAVLLWSPQVRALGTDLRLWSASYVLYLLAVFFPQSSTLRLLLPLSPLWGAVAIPRADWYRWGMLLLCLLGQWLWIWQMYALGNTYWQVP
jgi:hypothetical protein